MNNFLLIREDPGSTQKKYIREKIESAALEEKKRELELRSAPPFDPEASAIVGSEWKLFMEAGVRTNFKEGKVRWHGHVSVKIFETLCWLGPHPEGIYIIIYVSRRSHNYK
jgi:hypothetical protein